MASTSPEGPIGQHIAKRGEGLHHLAFSVDDIRAEIERLKNEDVTPEPGGTGQEAAARCEPFTDRRIRNIDLTVATDVRPFSLGLQGSWRDNQSRLGQRPGSTQLEISLFGQFLFETGEIR